MSSILAPAPVESNRGLLFQLRKMITNPIDLLDASSRLGVTLSTLRKVLSGGPISPFIQKKIGQALTRREGPSPIQRKPSDVERLLQVHHLYQERGTLQQVANEIGLSRERVRQLLVKGSEFGLFEYEPFSGIEIPRKRIIADYRHYLTLKGVAKVNEVSISYLKRLLKLHGISHAELAEIGAEARKVICAERYHALVRELGHHPTTTELQRTSSTHYLATQIRRLWGSIEDFRRSQRIPAPPNGRRYRLHLSTEKDLKSPTSGQYRSSPLESEAP